MDQNFLKTLFDFRRNNPNTTGQTEVIRSPPVVNTCEGGEYLDDNIRIENPLSLYAPGFEVEND